MASESEVLKALELLQSVCSEQELSGLPNKCATCILRNSSDSCGVVYEYYDDPHVSPLGWKLKKSDYRPRVIVN